MPQRFYLETLGCPKNQVDSEKIVGTLLAEGMVAAEQAADADLVVVNTCAFIEDARQESIDTILALDDARRAGSRLVVTGCLAERYGAELAQALPEADAVAGFGVPVSLTVKPGRPAVPSLDLLNLPRPPASAPWAYVKIAEGCDRTCGFCAIPSFRGPQRSRTPASILTEVDQLGAQEIVLVAQDLASYGKDEPGLGAGSIVPLVRRRRRPGRRGSGCSTCTRATSSDDLIDAICATGVPYFDLSLQHVSKPLLRRMRRWGDGDRFLAPHRRHPPARTRRRLPLQLHRGLSGRDRGRPRPAAVVRRRGPARLVRLLRLLQGGRDLRRRPGRRGARVRWSRSAWPSCGRSRTASLPPGATT